MPRQSEVSDSCVKTVLISFLRIYKLAISPLLPPSCRFIPTCSEYAIDAISVTARCAERDWHWPGCFGVIHFTRVGTIRLSESAFKELTRHATKTIDMALVISSAILFLWSYFYPAKPPQNQQPQLLKQQRINHAPAAAGSTATPTVNQSHVCASERSKLLHNER